MVVGEEKGIMYVKGDGKECRSGQKAGFGQAYFGYAASTIPLLRPL